ncbi:uncharacterized protein LOC130647151 [Hydractinia symbiolongicarpus]|uniref:uncharacterized protein LOC130647151 n=1 Tax=Hydractinia symbiolongicarpus TaxID=13093 RepID=UPI0025514198|nr:uncharacterized protein LOC130647151 [Hydractinia symbiolongicarpus]
MKVIMARAIARATETSLQSNTTMAPKKESGYDLALYGLDNGQFYAIHLPALTCIFLSLITAILVICFSFKHQRISTFFTWTKSERFVVYLAICDALFNICHSMDHLHIVITKDHVYPKALCEFYGIMLAEFITAQNLMVNVVSINAFVLIYFRKKLEFGKYDWKLLLWMFGTPFLAGMIALGTGSMGPNGTFCYFDGVKGEYANLFFTTVPLLLILTVNIIMYILTWYRIQKEEPKFKDVSGKDAHVVRASHRAAKTMSLFVAAFFIQWWAMALYGVWQLVADVPQALFQFVTTFSNIGGILNGIVYVIIRRKKGENHSEIPSESSKKFSRMNNNHSVSNIETQHTSF